MRVDRVKLYDAANLFMDAAFEDRGLVPALEVLTEALGATSGVIIPLTSRAAGPAPATQSAEELMSIYMKDGWYKNDLRMAGFQDMIRRGVTTDQDMFPIEVMQRAPYYQEFLRKANMLWFMGLGLKIGDEIWAAALQRSPAQGAFLPEEQEMALSVMDRVSRGASLAADYNLAKIKGVTSFHESFRQPILQVNRSGEVIDLNAPAEALMGRGISVVNKQIIVSKPDADRVAEFVSALVSFQDPVPHIARQSISVRRLHGRPLDP